MVETVGHELAVYPLVGSTWFWFGAMIFLEAGAGVATGAGVGCSRL